jgi:hypothetical protein
MFSFWALRWGANVGGRSWTSGMARASRRGYGEDGIYFDHRDDCRDSVLHKTCAGRWRGVVSLGFCRVPANLSYCHSF